MKGSQGTPVPAYNEIKADAVAVNTGAPHAHIKGNEYDFGGLYAILSATAVSASATAADSAAVSIAISCS